MPKLRSRRTSHATPYDEFPYKSLPVEWSAPERLALASLLRGGPRPPLDAYHLLEVGCGNGANLLALAYYRRHASFLGLDGAATQIRIARERASALGLVNVEFVHSDFGAAECVLSGEFDYILAHGVISWVPDGIRDALLAFFATRLRAGGVLYLDYNAKPGWNVRGMIRKFLLAQTADIMSLPKRARKAQEVAGRLVTALNGMEHPYSRLLASEFEFVYTGESSWIAHEYLAQENRAYWRSEFMDLARKFGLDYVGDADFNYSNPRIAADLLKVLDEEQIGGCAAEDTVDFLCYRQLHSSIFTRSGWKQQLPALAEIRRLFIASCLEPCALREGNPIFRHPSGYEVEAKEACVAEAFTKLKPLWPQGLPLEEVFPEVSRLEQDLRLLHQNRLIDLRCVEPAAWEILGDALNALELDWGGYFTNAYHQVFAGNDLAPGVRTP